jgi:hypothetical protein
MRPETTKLIQHLILSAMSNIEAWERWAGIVPTGASYEMHQSLIRLSKGMVKAGRKCLCSLEEQNHNLSSLPVQPPSATFKEAENARNRQDCTL